MLFRKFLGWEEASLHEYRDCYEQFGGNFSTNPDVLNYIHNHADCNEKYYIHQSSGKMNGAVCVWKNKYLANDIVTCDFVDGFPVSKDELILPITTNKKIIIPWKSKIVSSVNKNILNRNERFNARRTICLAKPLSCFSKKTIQTRNRELNKFIRDGGDIKDQSEFNASDIVDIYSSLYESKRGKKIQSRDKLLGFMAEFRDYYFGKVLFYKNMPCAFQLITKNLKNGIASLDFINLGINNTLTPYSLFPVLLWVNTNEAYKTFTEESIKLRYSFGRPSSDYKQRWCFQEKLGRLL